MASSGSARAIVAEAATPLTFPTSFDHSMHKLLLTSSIITLGLFGRSHSLAAEPPIRLISAQVQPQSKNEMEMTRGAVPFVITGEADSNTFIVGNVVNSYDFALYDATRKVDTGQSPSGFSYLLDGNLSKQTPAGKYRFIIRYWLQEDDAKKPIALYYKRKPVSNAITINGKYEGNPF